MRRVNHFEMKLWNDDVPEHEGKHFHLPKSGFAPKPLTRPHPPFVIGGTNDRALERAAKIGNGWFAVGLSPETIAPKTERLRALLESMGRGNVPFEVTAGTGFIPGKQLTRDDIEAWKDAGVDRLIVRPWKRGREALSGIEALAKSLGLQKASA